MRNIRMGVVGFGNMGQKYCSLLSTGGIPGMELGGICVARNGEAEEIKQKYPGIPVFISVSEMFTCACIDAVEIATPHYSHPAIAMEAFRHGIHVLIEKPAGVYTKQVLEMNAAAKKSGLLFGIMYNQRTNPVYQTIRQMVQGGKLGHVKRISWTVTDWYRSQAYHDSKNWRSTWELEGGGVLINQSSHQLDLWQWIFGMPFRLMAHVSFGKYYDIEVEDDVTAYMEYENGTTGTYITSTGEAPGTNRLEVACDMGKLVVENNKIVFWQNRMSERLFNEQNRDPFGRPENRCVEIPVGQAAGMQQAEILRNFAGALNEGTPLLAPGEEGIRGLTLSNGILYSSWTDGWADIAHFPHDRFYELLKQKIKDEKDKKQR